MTEGRTSLRRLPAAIPASLLAWGAGAASAAETEGSGELEEVTIIAVTPLHGIGLSPDKVPSNIRRAGSEDIEAHRAASLAQFMSERFGSVYVSEAQASLLQPDVLFRGFTASPLLGQAQGLAVYQDGVRINEPFGDTVNWALVPESAIASVNLIPGSNPLFGLNTLGGALSIRTKNGFDYPGTRGELLLGSFERVIAEAETGGALGERAGYFLTARYLDESGWRDFSPSQSLHVFGDFGWRSDDSSLELGLTRVDTDLVGNGPAPVQLLEIDRRAIFTRPDRTENSLGMLSVTGSHRMTWPATVQGVLYYRASDIHTLNGDDSEFEACTAAPGLLCDDDGELVLDANGDAVVAEPAVSNATVNRSATLQDGYGTAAQIAFTGDLAGRDHQLILGAALDRSRIRFDFSSELGQLDDTRQAVPGGVFVGESFVALHTRTRNHSVYLADTLAITPALTLSLSGRYNNTSIELRDQLGSELTGDHRFRRFNPAAGLTWRLSQAAQVYASYGESSRAPSPVELTCADEDDPCRLPNSFLSDPPLEQVVARSIEAGVRGRWPAGRWHAGAFRTANRNDIIFVSAGAATNQGFFDNIGTTRRQGVEVHLEGGARAGRRLGWYLDYTHLDATFRDSFRVSSPHNPAAEAGEIAVSPGDRLPGVPRHLAKLGASLAVGRTASIAAELVHNSRRYLRGDEANLTAPLPGFTVVNLRGEYRLDDHFTLLAKVENLFDRRYDTFGLFGAAEDVLGDAVDDPRFHSPGAPFSGWIGLSWTLAARSAR